MSGKKVAVIHTTPVTIPTLRGLIDGRWKAESGGEEEIQVVNFLDDSMLPEINREGRVTEGVKYRLDTLLTMTQTTGADAVLCACSSIGGLIDEGRELVRIPVLRIDEPMAEKAASFSRIGVAATLMSTILPTTALIRKKAESAGRKAAIESTVIDGVGSLLAEGRGDEYDRIVSDRLRGLLETNEVVVLAQASMARAVENWPEEERARCLTSPESGVERLCEVLMGD